MKKLLLVSLMTLLVCVLPVAASNDHSTELSYTVEEAYEWSAPADITFTNNINSESKTGSVSVTQNIIAGNKKLQIKIASGEDFKLTSAAGDFRTYQVKKGSDVLAAGAVVLEVASGVNTSSQELSFALQSAATQKAGTYTGICEFEAGIVSAS